MESLGLEIPDNFDEQTNIHVKKIMVATSLNEEDSLRLLEIICLRKLINEH